MQSIIRLLPDHIANQIAAGEVVQRPASVVKELLENAIDAGAQKITLSLKDAGKTLIQVTDTGSGMSPQDARMSFERHATSKIASSDDLFNIRTMGFRGEALASIAAVAQVSMRTRQRDTEVGTEIVIEGGEIRNAGPCVTAYGTSIAVKNLFFNVPARRNFLKSNPVEMRHILQEFTRIALAHPEVHMVMEQSGEQVFDLPGTTLERRITGIMGKELEGQLLTVEEDTPYVRMRGFVGKPEAARKARENFFFVNTRFIRSHYLHHAVNAAYAGMLPEEHAPFYCIFLEIEPKHVDINIHPTKTEVKFDDERTVYALLHSVVRKALAAVHDAPLLADSDLKFAETVRNTPPPREQGKTLGELGRKSGGGSLNSLGPTVLRQQQQSAWEELYKTPLEVFEKSPEQEKTATLFGETEPAPQVQAPAAGDAFIVQYENRFLVTPGRKGLLLIDQRAAHERILYESWLEAAARPPASSQQLLFPHRIPMAGADFLLLEEILPDLHHVGLDMQAFGRDGFMLQGLPAGVPVQQATALVQDILAEVRDTGGTRVRERIFERLARALARGAAVPAGRKLNPTEMREIAEGLFKCQEPNFSPGGKPTYYLLSSDTLTQFFRP